MLVVWGRLLQWFERNLHLGFVLYSSQTAYIHRKFNPSRIPELPDRLFFFFCSILCFAPVATFLMVHKLENLVRTFWRCQICVPIILHILLDFRFKQTAHSNQKNLIDSWNTSVVWSILLLFFRLFLFAPILAHHVSGTWKVTGMGSEIRVAAGLEPDCSDLRTLFLISYNSQNQPIKKLKK